MIVVNSVQGTDFFELNGIRYAKVYQPLKIGADSVSIQNAFDVRGTIQEATLYNEYIIDGDTFGNQLEVMNALLSVIWSGNIENKTDKGGYEGTSQDLKNEIDSIVFEGAKTYQTLADLQAVNPVPDNGTAAKVVNDNNPDNNGFYSVSGGAWVADGDIYSNNLDTDNTTDAVTGKAVADYSIEVYKERLETSLKGLEGNFWTTFKGENSRVDMSEAYVLEFDGDYIEFDVKVNDITGFRGLGIAGENGTTSSGIGFSTNGQLFVRDRNGVWITTSGFIAGISSGDVVTLRLEWVNGGVKSYKNGVFQKNIVGGVVVVDRFGSAYFSNENSFDGYVKKVKIFSSGTLKEIDNLFLYEGNQSNVNLLAGDDGYMLQDQIEMLNDVADNKENVGKVIDLIEKDYFVRYNNVDSYTVLPSSYTLSNVGDYFEIESRFLGSNFNDGLGLIGTNGSTSNTFGYYSNSQIWFRSNNGTVYSQLTGLTGLGLFKVFRLEVIAGDQWEVFIDGVSAGTFAKESDFIVSNIGNAYTSASSKVDVKSVKINVSGVETVIDNLFFSDANNVNIEVIEGGGVTDNMAEFAKCYVSFDPVGNGVGQGRFIAYLQNEADKSEYFGFEIIQEVDADEAVYVDFWRVGEMRVYTYDGDVMADIGMSGLNGGESEFVYRTPNKNDFTGGFHGDQIVEAVNFFIDGSRVTDLSNAFDLIPCSTFSYDIRSTLHETADENDNVNPSHPVEARHWKKTIVEKEGFESFSRVQWLANIPVEIVYGSIVSIGLDFGGHGQTDNFEIVQFVQDGGRRLQEINDNVHVWNEQNNTSSSVESEFKVIESAGNNSNLDIATNSNQFIWDTTVYNKYYREVTNTNVVNGEIWEMNTKTKFKKYNTND